MGTDRMELRIGGDYVWATRGTAVIIIAGIAMVGLVIAWYPPMEHGRPVVAVWSLGEMLPLCLVWLYELM
jgi:hypothetical protein